MTIDRTPRPCLHKQANHQHGQRATYVLDRCRCLPCAAANSAAEDRRARLRAYGRGTPTGLVDATPVRAHVEQLQAAGMGWKRIAKTAGVPNGTMSRLLFGKPEQGCGPSKRINPDAARRLLAVPPPTIDQLGDAAVVDGCGTRRRLQSLVAAGWPQRQLAAQLGTSAGNFNSLVHGHQRKNGTGDVLVRTRRAVTDLYDQLRNQAPPAGVGPTRARNTAARHGWAPPLAWDDDTIDDPAALPDLGDDGDLVDEHAIELVVEGVRGLKLTGATLHAAVHVLTAAGHQPDGIAQRLGIQVRQAQRLRDRDDAPRPKRSPQAA